MAMTEYTHTDDILGTTYEWDARIDNFDASTVIWSTQNLRSYKANKIIITWTEV